MTTEFDEGGFEEQKRRSFLQVLFKAARLADEAALEMVHRQTGEYEIRPAHTRLFPHIPFDGIRLTELADRLGVTKQAVAVLVDDLEEAGFVERIPDPDDGRAKLIRWSESGREGLSFGVSMLREFEKTLARELGEEALRTSHETLLRLVDYLEEE